MTTAKSPPSARPTALQVTPEAVPEMLRKITRWVGWKFEWRQNSQGVWAWTKPPVNVRTGGHASATDPATWASFEEALAAVERFELDGIGFALGDDFVGVDLDHCRDPETGALEPWAADIVEILGSYSEASPRGEGAHVLALGKLPPKGRRRGSVEMYSESRYFTVTGHRLPWTPDTPQERTAELAIVHARWIAKEDHAHAERGGCSPPGGEHHHTADNGLDDEELIRIAGAATNGERFRRLWAGDIEGYQSGSEADAALACLLAFYAGGDSARVERLFSRSGLGQREKWQRPDYRERTIRSAIDMLGGKFYTGKSSANNGSGGRVVDGPGGMKLVVDAVTKTKTKTSVRAAVWIGTDKLSATFTDAPSSIDRTARDLAGMAGVNDILAVKRVLMALVNQAQKPENNASKQTTKTPMEIVLAEAGKLDLRYVDERERVWSEKLGRLLYARQLAERLINSDTINKLTVLPEFLDAKRAAIISAAKRLAEEAFATLASQLPTADQADSLGPQSRAAEDARQALLTILHAPRGTHGDFDSRHMTSLASAALEAEPGKGWTKAMPPLALWSRVDKTTGELQLAATFQLLVQTRTFVPGVTDQQSFGRVLERLGILKQTDMKQDRCGQERTRVRQISADIVAEVAALYQDVNPE